MFASFALPLDFRSRCERTQCSDVKADKGQTEALPDGPAESGKHSKGSLVADTFIVDKEPDDNGKMMLIAKSVTDQEAGPTKN